MSAPKYVLAGPFGNGNASAMTVPVPTRKYARSLIDADRDYFERYSDTEGMTYYLYDIGDYLPDIQQVDGYPLVEYTITTRGIRTNDHV